MLNAELTRLEEELADSREKPAPAPGEPAARRRDRLRARPAAADGRRSAPTRTDVPVFELPAARRLLGAGDPRASTPGSTRSTYARSPSTRRSLRRGPRRRLHAPRQPAPPARHAAAPVGAVGRRARPASGSARSSSPARGVLRRRGHPPGPGRPGGAPAARRGLPRRHAARPASGGRRAAAEELLEHALGQPTSPTGPAATRQRSSPRRGTPTTPTGCGRGSPTAIDERAERRQRDVEDSCKPAASADLSRVDEIFDRFGVTLTGRPARGREARQTIRSCARSTTSAARASATCAQIRAPHRRARRRARAESSTRSSAATATSRPATFPAAVLFAIAPRTCRAGVADPMRRQDADRSRQHVDWLTQVDTEGPFLALPVLKASGPTGWSGSATPTTGWSRSSRPSRTGRRASTRQPRRRTPRRGTPTSPALGRRRARRPRRVGGLRITADDLPGRPRDPLARASRSRCVPTARWRAGTASCARCSPSSTPTESLRGPGWTGGRRTRSTAWRRCSARPSVEVGIVTDGRWWAIVWAKDGKPTGSGMVDALTWARGAPAARRVPHADRSATLPGQGPRAAAAAAVRAQRARGRGDHRGTRHPGAQVGRAARAGLLRGTPRRRRATATRPAAPTSPTTSTRPRSQ